jgi:DNA processing protein
MNGHTEKLSDSEKLDRLRLIRTDGVGPRTFSELVGRYGSAGAALDALPALARKSRKPDRFRVPSADAVRAEFDSFAGANVDALFLGEPDYPQALAAIDDPPPILFLKGDASLLGRPMIAIVGARNASSNGRAFASDIAAELGAAGQVVVSGLARGIDGAAHRGSLATGTVAVVAGGCDVVYPPEHRELQDEIAEKGLIVSEQPIGTVPTARHFPARNRLISGLSAGVLVVEAALRSGSLITARLALEQGRDVFAVPGSPRDPRCGGTNDLLRQGAVLTEKAADIIDALSQPIFRMRMKSPPAADPETIEFKDEKQSDDPLEKIAGLLSGTPTGVDELVRECHMSAAAIQTALLELELEGRMERHPGNRFSLVL